MSKRNLVAALSLSAAAFIALAVSEGYTGSAVIPTQGDRPTLGFGSTFHESGKPVTLNDTTTPVRALIKAQAHISKEEIAFRRSLPGVELTQAEYDLYIDFLYQYGIGNWRKPESPRTWLLKGDYVGACEALLNWRYAAGYDCSTTINGKPNRRCWGVWARQLERHSQCVAAQ